jgi:hypothetical protein
MAELKDFGLWTRRLLALLIVGCFVWLSIQAETGDQVNPALGMVQDLSFLVLGFYFGQPKEST